MRRSRSAPPGPIPSRGRTDRGNVEDLIDQLSDSDGRVFHAKYGSANSTGVEVEAEHRSAGGILTRGSLVFQRAFDEKTGERLSNAPPTLATLSFAAPIAAHQVTLALDSRFVGPRLTVARHSLNSVVLADLIATWQPRSKPFTIQTGVYNLFDREFADPVGVEFVQESIPQDGRTAAVKVGFRF